MKLLKQKGPSTLKPMVSRPLLYSDQSLSTNYPASNELRKISPEIGSPRTPKKENRRRLNYLSQDPLQNLSPMHDSSRIQMTGKSPLAYPHHPKLDSGLKLVPGVNSGIDQLEVWLEKMKETHLPELDSIMRKNLVPRSEITKKVEDIYSMALSEIVKQVTLQNRARGELLEKVLNTLRYVWNKYPQHLNFLLEKEKEFFEKNSQELELKYQSKIEKYKQRARVLQIKLKKNDEDKEMITKELVILRKSAMDYRTEVSQLVKFNIKTTSSVAVQAEDPDDWLKKSIQKSITRYNSMKEYGSKIQLGLRSWRDPETPRVELKVMTQEKLTSEILRTFGNAELSPEFDLEAVVETVFRQTSNLFDWLSGFRLGFNLAEKVSIKTKSLLLVKDFNEKLEISSITNKSSRVRSPRLENIENISATAILKGVLALKEEMLAGYAKDSSKKILKNVGKSIYNSFGKKFSKDFNMIDLVFQELNNRYNVRKIAERKLKELIVGCILNASDFLRIRMFAGSLGCAGYVKARNYSLEGTAFYVKLYENMVLSKTGIVLEPADPLAVELYPLARANETMKALFSRLFPFDLLNSLFLSVKKQSEADPNHINKEGVVKLDSFIDTCLNFYEDFRASIERGVAFAAKSITELNYLNKGEATVLLKHLAYDKKELVKELFETTGEIDLEHFQHFCIENGLLCEEEVMKFFVNCEKDWKKVEVEVRSFENELIDAKFETFEGLSQEEMKGKLEDMLVVIRGKRHERVFYMWHLIKKEMNDLRSMGQVIANNR